MSLCFSYGTYILNQALNSINVHEFCCEMKCVKSVIMYLDLTCLWLLMYKFSALIFLYNILGHVHYKCYGYIENLVHTTLKSPEFTYMSYCFLVPSMDTELNHYTQYYHASHTYLYVNI